MATTSAATAVKPVFDPKLGVFVDKDGKPIPRKSVAKRHGLTAKDFKLDTRSVFDKEQDLIIDRVVTKDADGFYTKNAGRKELPVSPRKLYKKGAQFLVVGVNVRMEAMLHFGENANGSALWSGWSTVLPVGTVVRCLGWRRFRKDGLVAPQFTFDGLPAEAKWSWIWPLDSVWRPWPLVGILELIETLNTSTASVEELARHDHVHDLEGVCVKRRTGLRCGEMEAA